MNRISVADMMAKLIAAGRVLGLLCAVGLLIPIAGCDESSPSTPDDGRPSGTVRVRIPLAEQCDVDSDTRGDLYDGLPNVGGTLIESQKVVNRELNFYLPPSSGLYWLVVMNGSEQLVEISFQTSERDLEFDPPVVCE